MSKLIEELVADIAGGVAPERIPESAFDGMRGVFIPRRIRRHERLLRSESGKIVGKPEGAKIGDYSQSTLNQ